MDCEGCEYDVILSASSEDLKRAHEWIVEYHGCPEPLAERLKASGFKVDVKRPWTTSVGFIHAKKLH
jgi:hypothetical protein